MQAQYENGKILREPLQYVHCCSFIQNGSVKLEDIFTGNDFTGFSVSAVNSAMSGYFQAGIDSAGDPAIIYSYIPDTAAWDDAAPHLPIVNETLILSKQEFGDHEINVALRYNGSIFSKG